MKSDQVRQKEIIVIIFAIVLATSRVVWVGVHSKNSTEYFIRCSIVACVIAIGIIIYRYFTKLQCPRCGSRMSGTEWDKRVFEGAIDNQTKKPYSPLLLKVKVCPRCEIEHHTLVIDPKGFSFTDSWHLYNNNMHYLKKSLPEETEISAQKYKQIENELITKVKQNNRHAGFPENDKDIKLN